MKFSVIVPTFNRPGPLEQCLSALAALAYPTDQYEVIVVDDGGSVDLASIANRAKLDRKVTVVRQQNSGPAGARNTGAAHAAGRFLAFIDDDCEPSKVWLSALEAQLTLNADALVGGPVVNGLPDNRYAVTSQIVGDFCHRHFNESLGSPRFFPSNNIALASDLYRSIGGFDANFGLQAGEDRDFCDRWLGRGLRLEWAADAVVTHRHEMGFWGFCLQHFNYGRGGLWYSALRRRRQAGPVPFEGWGFHLGIVVAPFGTVPSRRAPLLAALVLVSQSAVALGYACELSRFRRSETGALTQDAAK